MARLTKAQQAELELQRKAQAMKEFRDQFDDALNQLIKDINYVNRFHPTSFVVSVDGATVPTLMVSDIAYGNDYSFPMAAVNFTSQNQVYEFYDVRNAVDAFIAEIKETQRREDVKRSAIEKIRQVLNEEELELLKSANLKL